MAETTREMTPELQAKLAGLLPISKKVGVPFTPPGFEAEDLKPFRPVFMQRGWSEDEQKQLNNAALKETFTPDFMVEMARVTVVNVENLIDISKGSEIPFIEADNGPGMNKKQWGTIPFKLQMAVFKNAQKLSGLCEVEKEGLESSPLQTQE